MTRSVPRLDFVPSPPWSRWGGHVLLAIGVLACLLAALRYREAVAARDLALDRLRPEAVAPVAAPPSREAAAEAAEARAVAAALAVPWDAWFRALESVSVPGVVLTALQPEGARQRVRISGEAAGLSLAIAYLQRLEQTPGFRRVLLAEHALEDGPPPRVRFSLTADWEAP